jgi:RNA polymerase sigma factor (sigma-70 family)
MTTTTTPLEQLAARTDNYARYIHRHFSRKLSAEDCADAVQDAFVDAAASDVCAGLDEPRLEAWIKHAAYTKALDTIRGPEREGRGAVRRRRTDIDQLAEILPDLATLGEEDTTDDDAAAVLAAFQRLPALEQRIIGLRHLDNLPRQTCAELVGLPVTKYKRAHTEAVRRLIALVVETRPHDTCLEARSLINLSVQDMLDDQSAARRDAHLAGCAHCRQYQRRSRGLLIFLPIPALTFRDRLASILHGLLERVIPATAAADAATTAGGASGAGVLGAGGVKAIAVLASGTLAVGGGSAAVAITKHGSHASHKAKTTRVAKAAAAVEPTVTTATASVQRTYASRTATTTVAKTVKAMTKTKATNKRASVRTAKSASASASGELKPLGHEVSVTPTTTTVAPAPVKPAYAAATPTSPKSSSVAVPSEPKADSSSGEFAPQP